MKFLNDLYTILDRQPADGATTFRIRLNPDHIIYKAHFPEMPITPGVCIVQIVQELLSEALGRTLQLTRVKNVKFLSIISPAEVLEMNVIFNKVEEAENVVKVQCCIKNETVQYAKLSLLFSPF